MNAATPVSSDRERVNLCYRVALPGTGRRVLEIYADTAPVLDGASWRGVTLVAAQAHELSLERPRFDAIVAHRALDELANAAGSRGIRFDARAFLARVHALLVPGGTFAGFVQDREAAAGWLSLGARAWFSASECRALLEGTGFDTPQLFSAVPKVDGPRKLLALDGPSSRQVVRRHAEALRPLFSCAGYWGRRIGAEVGLLRHFGEAVFFSARRPC
jgi:hypothetical protein